MRRFLLLVCAVLAASSFAFAQDYSGLVRDGLAAYQAKDYPKSVVAYAAAFKLDAPHQGDLYNAACSAALAGKPELALEWLQKAADLGLANPQHLQSDPDLVSLHDLPPWAAIVAAMKQAREALDAKIDKPLRAELRAVLEEDQKYRKQIEAVQKASGPDSPEVRALWKTIGEKDAANLVKVEAILDSRGWLGSDVVGADGNSALFLVIQHADLKTQEKYLPMMRDAVKDKRAKGSSLALLEDRIAIREGRHQIYGSQLGSDRAGKYYLSPLEDPDHVDARRATVGLAPLAEYLKHWDLTWDPAEYKKQLPALEELERQNHGGDN